MMLLVRDQLCDQRMEVTESYVTMLHHLFGQLRTCIWSRVKYKMCWNFYQNRLFSLPAKMNISGNKISG